MTPTALPDVSSLEPTEAPATMPALSDLEPTEAPSLPPDVSALEPLPANEQPIDEKRFQSDLDLIGARIGDLDNPVEILRTVKTDPALASATNQQVRDHFVRAMEAQVVPQMKTALGIKEDAEALNRLYTEPGILDYGRELGRSFVPMTKETLAAQASGLSRFAGNQVYREALSFMQNHMGAKNDAEAAKMIEDEWVKMDAEKPKPKGFWQIFRENAGRVGNPYAGPMEGALYGIEDERDSAHRQMARRARQAVSNLGTAKDIDLWREEVRKASPDDPRIAGTNAGAFIEGMAQMPANMVTSVFHGVRELSNFSQLYDEAYQQAKQLAQKNKLPFDEKKAHEAATTAALINLPMEELSDLVLFRYGKKLLPDKIANRITRFQKARPIAAFVGGAMTKAMTEGLTELAQGGVTNVVTGAPAMDQANLNFFGGLGGGTMASSTDAIATGLNIYDRTQRYNKLIEEKRERAAARVAAAGPQTEAAVRNDPAVAAAVEALATSGTDYAAQHRAQLAAVTAGLPAAAPAQEATPTEGTPPAQEPAAPVVQPALQPPAEGTDVVQPASQEPTPEPAADEEAIVDGVPVERVGAGSIVSRPDLMQFKRMDEAATGVTESAKLEGTWDDLKAGNLLLWEPSNPAEHGLKDGERYIVANGHYRVEFGSRQGVSGYNAQILREADGFSAQDARRIGAEINIADSKGTIYDQAKFLRNVAATHGQDEALATGRRIGARGRQAASIAFLAGDPLYEAFINERVTPDAAEAIATAAPGNVAAQRQGIRSALAGKPPAWAANVARAAVAMSGGEAETMDLFGETEFAEMDAAAERATQAQQGISEQIRAVQSAARNPEAAARLGVNVQDPEGVLNRVAELKRDLERWRNWPMHPDLLALARGQQVAPPPVAADGRGVAPSDLFAGSDSDPFNLVSETTEEKKAREAREAAEAAAKEAEEIAKAKAEADKQQQQLFASPDTFKNPYAIGARIERKGREWRVTRDFGSHVELTAVDNRAIKTTIQKENTLEMSVVQSLIEGARVRLANFLANVGHPNSIFTGYHAGTTMYVGIDGSGEPRIYVNWNEAQAATAGMTEEEASERIYAALSEEIVHVAEVRFQAENPTLTAAFLDWVTNPNNPDYDADFVSFLRSTYTGFDALAPYQKAAEAARAIVQQRWIGKITEAVASYLRGLRDYLVKFVTGIEQKTPAYVQAYIAGIEAVLQGRTPPTVMNDTARAGEVRAAADQTVDDLLNRLAQGEETVLPELERILRARLGPVPTGAQGQSRGQRFFTAAEFEKYFEAQFLAQDFDAIVEAVKVTEAAIYTPLLKRLLKAQASDPAAAERAEYLSGVFTGRRPASAKPPQGAPKPPPTSGTPPPGSPPKTSTRAGTGPQQGNFNGAGFNRPPPPPPPPRPTGKHPFNIPALIYVARFLGSMPTINERLRHHTRGRFIVDSNGIELNAQLFKNLRQAARTLAHEIGHLFDFVAQHVAYGQLAEKVAPLRNWQAIFGDFFTWTGGHISDVQAALRAEAVMLSRAWRGDFGPENRYRNSAEELYADFISAVLNEPEWTFRVAPRLSNAFFAGLEQKPAVEEAYNLVNEMLRGDTLLDVLRAEQAARGRQAVSDMIGRTLARSRDQHSFRRVWSALYGGLINRSGPTATKAGGQLRQTIGRVWRGEFGEDYTTLQESAATYADRQNYLMLDRLKAGTYIPLQTHAIPDSDLDTYLRNRRIIHERTLTGLYLEQNPDEARELFIWMAEQAGLGDRWTAVVEDTPDSELYELGARIVYDIHETGSFDSVLQAAQRRDAPDFAERGLFAFDVSGFMLNPQGIDPENAQRQIDRIAGELGPARFAVLEGAAQNYYDTMREIVREANQLSLFRPKTWSERIVPNLDNYVPFMVIDYFTGHVDAGLRQRQGTARDVLPVHVAGQLKMSALLRRMQRQRQALLMQNFYRVEGAAHGFSGEMTIHTNRLTDAEQREIRRNGRGLVGFYQQGVWHWMEFQDGAAVSAMEQYDPQDLGSLLSIGRQQSNFWRMVLTTYSIAFTLWNALRTTRQVWASHGTRNLVNLFRSIPEARNYARAVVNGETLSPELRDLVDSGALPSPDRSLAGQGSPELLERMILSGMISAESMVNRTPHESTNPIVRFLRIPFGRILDGIAYLSGVVESAPKIATNRTLAGRGLNRARAAAFARLEGIPNPAISGKYNTAVEVALMFARVHLQGLRAFRTRALAPETRGGFMFRAVVSQLLWKSLYVAAAGGVIDWLFSGGDDEDKQVDWEEFAKRSTPYKLEMDDLIFLGWVRPDGGYEPPAGHSVIPADWTPLSIRIPHSEDGRYLSPFSALLTTELTRSDIRPVDGVQRSMQLAGSLVPGSNPGFDLLGAAARIGQKEPPQDSYRGGPMVDPDEWKAGYMSRIWGLTKHFGATIGIPGLQNRVKNDDLTWYWQLVRSTPGFGRLTPLDNYYGVREQRRIDLENERVTAKARNMRGSETVNAMNHLARLENEGAYDVEKGTGRDDADEVEYQRLREWYNEFYQGTPDFPGLFFTLKAKAAGRTDVDADYAKETLDETAKTALEEARQLAHDARRR